MWPEKDKKKVEISDKELFDLYWLSPEEVEIFKKQPQIIQEINEILTGDEREQYCVHMEERLGEGEKNMCVQAMRTGTQHQKIALYKRIKETIERKKNPVSHTVILYELSSDFPIRDLNAFYLATKLLKK